MTKLNRVSVLLLMVMGLVLWAEPGWTESKETIPKQGKAPRHLKQLPDGHWSANQAGASTEGYEVHTVKSGETLWEITRESLKDPFLWPQVWELNPNIVNPHWIYPGDTVLLKKMVVAVPQPEPAVTEVPPAAAPARPAPPAAPVEAAETPVQTTPPPAPAPVPVASYVQLNCAGFFAAEEIRPKMVIVGGEESENQTLFGDRDIVYLNQGTQAGIKPGEEYQIMRKLKSISQYGMMVRIPGLTSKYGHGYLDLGRVRILLAHEKSATAEVIFACEDLKTGDFLIPAEQRVSPVERSQAPFDKFAPPNDKTRGTIFYAKESKSVIGTGDIVYLSVGQTQNVQVGDYFRILRFFTHANVSRFNRPDFGKYRSTFDSIRKVIGELVVLRVEGKSATALVTKAVQDVAPGDGVELE